MPLFKIVSPGVPVRKMCNADTLQEIIDAAKEKLKLQPDVSYKVYL